MKKQVESLEHLENELSRYKEQKTTLEAQHYPKDQEEGKQDLLKFYSEKIERLQSRINTEKAKDISFKGTVVSVNQSG